MAETSYMGVQFTAEQQQKLNDDLANIDKWDSERAKYQGFLSQARADYNKHLNKNCGENSPFDGGSYESCMSIREIGMNRASSEITQYQGQLDAALTNLAMAKKNYDDDLAAIQNAIKVQIQASLANQQASTQNAQNQVTLNQNDPRLLLQKAEAEAAQKLKAFELQQQLDKQKRDQQVKVVGFVIIGILVLGIGWYVIKKLL